MKPSFVDNLICPDGGGPLQLEISKMEGEEVKEGLLHAASGLTYPVKAGVPRFVANDDYAATFSRQRQYVRSQFDTYRREFDYQETRELLVRSTGFDLSQIEGLTLDAGCGYGRFLRVLGQAGAEVVGVDLSNDSVELAYDFAGRADNVHVVQADLNRLPFPECRFRRAFSIGVLDHTPDTKTSFLNLLPYLEEGGEIAIWVYAPENRVSANSWRRLTTRVPINLVYWWCIVNELVFAWPRSLPYGGGRFSAIIPGGSINTPFWLRVMGGVDSLTPRYAHSHSADEVVGWCRDAGLVDIVPLPRATAVRAHKPFSKRNLSRFGVAGVTEKDAARSC
jgi:SAM-dependent methyltransferase